MKYNNVLLLLAPLKAWSRQCICGYANQHDGASVLPEQADTHAEAISQDRQQGSTDEHSQSAAAAGNGKQTGPQEYPFIAAVVYKSEPRGTPCAGAIIDEHHVLIAAHCVNGVRADDVGVYAGSNRFNATGAKLETVMVIHNHPQWDPERLVYDISLLQLQDSLTFDGHSTGAVCVLDHLEHIDNQKAVAVAWDSTWDGGQAVSPLLQATFETHDLASCSARPSGGPQFCAYGTEPAECQDAFEGPVLLWQNPGSRRYSVLGISSYGRSCRQAPEIVTDTTQLTPWMQSVLRTDGGRLCE
ncbi:trypsin precursor [Metarhizium album ARSEF 1941]|uniref:Trypsin n=1 Tax=Metarhizium album (strain ARSEF 1941) TaxID=1081103 RepID=A0A0B2WLF7_METAS|nr:trypsin precursor [Metarhizium album ARSEF 1941]KHN96901.1 trypsin precursor [Metarhizium album ARSEF 1941]